ncbi:MAG: NAD(P)H-binding protein [Pseudomonadales bacterium]|nr:NAD(P)H-binding protein [Pseudomonadales bacterium]
MKIAVTGANGHLGTRLIKSMLGEHEVVAIVRSEAARHSLLKLYPSLTVYLSDYKNAETLSKALTDCEAVVHLVGIIKESLRSRYVGAHENACTTLVKAASQLGVRRIIYLSIVGSAADASNTCLRSKGRAEQILLSSGIGTTVIKVPMVLGEGDFASYAIRKKANALISFGFRCDSLEQPIYAGDLIKAIQSILKMDTPPKSIQLAGPESLTRSALVKRAGQIVRKSPVLLSLPLSLGMFLACLFERLPQPPVTRAMLGVLDHDDNLDVSAACKTLSLKLTSLDDMLRKVITP